MRILSLRVNGKKEKIPEHIVEACYERGHEDPAIMLMTPKERFIEWCEWNGLIGYGDLLWTLVTESVKNSSSK